MFSVFKLNNAICRQKAMRTVFYCVFVFLFSACSTVTSYQKPVADFAVATKTAEAALIALDKSVTSQKEKAQRQKIVDGKSLIKAKDESCLAESTECVVIVQFPGGIKEQIPPLPALGNSLALMRSVTAYTQALHEIVTADTAAKVAASVNSSLGSIESLTKTVNKQTGATISAYKDPVSKAINWMFTQRIAKLQLDGLRQATSQAQPIILDAVRQFDAVTKTAEQLNRQNWSLEFAENANRYKRSKSETNLNAMLKSATAYNTFIQSRSSSMYAGLGQAHTALYQSLRGEGKSVVEVIASIEVFAMQVQTAVEVVREIEKASKK